MTVSWSKLGVRQMTTEEAEQVASWRYSGDWSVYDLPSAEPLVDELSSYYAVVADETLIGFCCIGEAARVAGLSEDPAILDVGLGMAPELIGLGYGTAFARTVLDYVEGRHPDCLLRAVVQSWNNRSLRVTERLGFEDVGERTTVQGGRPVSYRIVVKHRGQDTT